MLCCFQAVADAAADSKQLQDNKTAPVAFLDEIIVTHCTL